MGSATVPWNNFGDGNAKYYTGPASSRFAPKELPVTMNGKTNGDTNSMLENVEIIGEANTHVLPNH